MQRLAPGCSGEAVRGARGAPQEPWARRGRGQGVLGRVLPVPAQNTVYSSFYVAAVVKPSCLFFFFPAFSGRWVTSPRLSGGFLWRWDLVSPTTFYPCGCNHPSPDSLGVFRRHLDGLSEATPSLRRLL